MCTPGSSPEADAEATITAVPPSGIEPEVGESVSQGTSLAACQPSAPAPWLATGMDCVPLAPPSGRANERDSDPTSSEGDASFSVMGGDSFTFVPASTNISVSPAYARMSPAQSSTRMRSCSRTSASSTDRSRDRAVWPAVTALSPSARISPEDGRMAATRARSTWNGVAAGRGPDSSNTVRTAIATGVPGRTMPSPTAQATTTSASRADESLAATVPVPIRS